MIIENILQADHQIRLKVEVEPETLNSSKHKAARELAKRIRIPGFRPGKAPYSVILRQVGEEAITEDAINILLEEHYPKILDEAGISPYGPGSLLNIASMDPPTFEFLVPLEPEVSLEEYREIRVDQEFTVVSEDDVNRALDYLRERQATLESVQRPVEETDLVYITLSAQRLGDVDQSAEPLIGERRYPVIIEKPDVDNGDEWPFPGFSRLLIGLDAGTEKSFNYEFPEDYDVEELRSARAIYNVKVEEVKSRRLPEWTDDLVKQVSDKETLAELTEEIRSTLQAESDSKSKSSFEVGILQRVVESATVKYPPQMLDHELEHVLEDFEQELTRQGMSMELYLKSREIEPDALKEELLPQATDRIKRGLVLMEIARAEKISVSAEVVQERLNEYVQSVRQYLSEEDVRRLTDGNSLQHLADQIISDEVSKATLERLGRIARGESIETEEPTDEDAPSSPISTEELATDVQEQDENSNQDAETGKESG